MIEDNDTEQNYNKFVNNDLIDYNDIKPNNNKFDNIDLIEDNDINDNKIKNNNKLIKWSERIIELYSLISN